MGNQEPTEREYLEGLRYEDKFPTEQSNLNSQYDKDIDDIFLPVIDQIATRRITDEDIEEAKKRVNNLLVRARIDEVDSAIKGKLNSSYTLAKRLRELQSQLKDTNI